MNSRLLGREEEKEDRPARLTDQTVVQSPLHLAPLPSFQVALKQWQPSVALPPIYTVSRSGRADEWMETMKQIC
jgi:hypothetical protein